MATFSGDTFVRNITFSPDSKTVAVGDHEGRVCLWDIAKSEVIDKPGPNSAKPVDALLFSPDGKYLVYATRDGTIKLYDVRGHKALTTLKGYETSDQALAFSKDGKVLAYAERRGGGEGRPRVKFWDVAAGKEAGEMLLATGGVSYLHQLDDGKSWLVWFDRRTTLEVVDPKMTLPEMIRTPRIFQAAEHPGSLWCVGVSPDRKKLLLSVGKEVRIIDMPDFAPKDAKKKPDQAGK